MSDIDPYHLPRTVIPYEYDLRLEPNLDEATFSGSEVVNIEVFEATDEIVLNALELEIDEAWLQPWNSDSRVEATVTLDAQTERAHLRFAEVVESGAFTLHIRFRGTLNEKLTGFYRSTYTDENGVEQVIAATQLQATHARKAFPCWDEPDLKAVFAVTLVVGEGLTAISNAAEKRRSITDDGRVAVQFEKTMKMSTYLVAFIVGPLDLTEPVAAGGTPIRVAYPRGKGDLAQYGLDVGSFCLDYFADYYGIVYPGDKLDMIALPDFAFGAMENLGCVTFREALLLVDPAGVSQGELQRVVDVIAHELAHMWFGDLVTMRWWNGIWLNEAFATFMELKAADSFRPDWNRWTQFGLERTAALEVDALESTRPIEFPVVSPQEAEAMFDVLTYQKGAAVLRMLEQYLGELPFREGIRAYLAKHSYSNTETGDLWDAIEEATDEPARRIMDSWIFQGGYPMVSVEVFNADHDEPGAIEIGENESIVRLVQQRFRYNDGSGRHLEDDDTVWSVPVLLKAGFEDLVHTERVLLEGRTADVSLPFDPEWVIVNEGGSGFYRVNYSTQWRESLPISEMTPLERYNLVDDTFAAVLGGMAPAHALIDLTRSFAEETDGSIWKRLVGALGTLDRLVPEAAKLQFESTVRALLAPAWKRLGTESTENEDDLTRELRATLFAALGTLGNDTDIQARARTIHEAYLAEPQSVEPNLAAAAVNVVAYSGGAEEFQLFRERFNSSTNPQEQVRYLYALARFRDPALFQQVLDASITAEVRTQNAPYLLGAMMQHRDHGELAWRFITSNWDTVNERFPSSTIVRMLDGVRALTGIADEVEAFFQTHPVPQGGKTLEQHLERLRVNVAFRNRESDRFVAGLG